MADLRFNCTEKYKKQIKKQAVDKGVSVSTLLSEVVLSAIPADEEFVDYDELKKELDIAAGIPRKPYLLPPSDQRKITENSPYYSIG